VETSIDVLHCGNCATSCAPGVACVGGNCVPGACTAPLTSCFGGAACIDVRNDPANCGACGSACPPPPHAVAACAAMSCVLAACQPGFEDCNGGAADGCEANLQTDNLHCGFCAHTCGGGTSCSNGQCCTALPVGPYQTTCTSCTACDGKLFCLCEAGPMMSVPAIVDLGCQMEYLNCFGNLICGSSC
jgi:hypothetical protein